MEKEEIFGDSEAYAAVKPKIAVIGVGGGGCNSIRRLCNMGVKNVDLIAVNTDVNHFLTIKEPSIKKVLIGKKVTGGMGAGGYPEVGEKCAVASNQEISALISDVNLLFITAGMGGGTGTGAAPVIAKIAKDSGAIVISIVTYPFKLERARIEKAKQGLQKLREVSDTVIVIDNNKLVEYVPNMPIDKAFEVADSVISKAVKGITETILQPSLINMDFADFKAIMKNGDVAMISVGRGSGPDRIKEAVRTVLAQPLLDIDYKGASGALIHVTGGDNLSLGEAQAIGEMLTKEMAKTANVIWGARIDPKMGDEIEVILIMTGVKSPLILGKEVRSAYESMMEERMMEKQKVESEPTQMVVTPTSGKRPGDYKIESEPTQMVVTPTSGKRPADYKIESEPTQMVVTPTSGKRPADYKIESESAQMVVTPTSGKRPGDYKIESESAQVVEISAKKSDIIGDIEDSFEDSYKPKILVVGVGGAGNNSITRLSRVGVKGADLVAINTDKNFLDKMVVAKLTPIKKVLIGGKLTKGLGAGGFPEVGEKAAQESSSDIRDALEDAQLVFLTAGMGGGTGTGAAPVIAKMAKERGAIVVAIVTFPFALERARIQKAREGIINLTRYADTVVVIDNKKLVEYVPNLSIDKAFMVADEVIIRAVKGITETIMTPSLMNLDFADIKTVMGGGDLSLICVGEGYGTNKIEDAVKSTLSHPLLEVSYTDATGALIHISGGEDLTLGEANTIVERISAGVNSNAKVIWGARINPDLKDKVEVMCILTGVKSKHIFGGERLPEESYSAVSIKKI